jgi:hypothetical protein
MAFRSAALSAASCLAGLSRQAQQSGVSARGLQQLRHYAAEPAVAAVDDTGYVAQVIV